MFGLKGRAAVAFEMGGYELPPREGPRPRTTPTNPHTQLDQNPDHRSSKSWPGGRCAAGRRGASERHLGARARALWLSEDVPAGPREAFMIGREFAHIHPMPDGSLRRAAAGGRRGGGGEGWAEQHPVARLGYIPENVVAIYAPRRAGAGDRAEAGRGVAPIRRWSR